MEKKIDTFASDYKMLFYREGPSATVSVLEKDNNRFLRINGKTDGSNVTGQRNDNYTQTLLGLLPMIYNEKKEKALVIGVGTGITIGSLLDYPGVKVDCVEISQAVVEASRFFNDSNGNALDSPRTSTHILDGRTWLMSMPKKYDMIISEPSHPWQTGNANLFTTDFFDLSVKKLDKGGVFCQWLPYYRMDQEHFKILVNSFKNIFNYVNAWIIYTDVILIGSDSPLSIDYQLLEDFISADSIKNRLAGININSIPDLLSFFYLDTQGVNKFIDKTKTLNTDNNPVIEFSAPKYLLKYQRAESFYEMLKYSLNSKIPVANTDNIKSIEKDRIYKRIEYFKQWGIPEHAALAMLEAYGY